MKKIILIIAFLFAFAQAVFAQNVLLMNQNGIFEKQFNQTDTVILAPTPENITSNSTSVSVYVVTASTSWTNGTVLHDVRGSPVTNFTTNASGFLTANNTIWAPTLALGNYDVVIDANGDGIYEPAIDFVNDTSVTGFEVIPAPGPTLTVAAGENNTSDKTVSLTTTSQDVVMMQIKMTAGSVEAINVNSISLIAYGSGDDSKGISLVKLVADANQNGIYDSGENILAGSKYLLDNGIATLPLSSPFTIPINQSLYFLVVYTLTNSSKNEDTYAFQLASVGATGFSSGNSAKVSGVPINSPTVTISAAATTTTTTTSLPSSTSTTTSVSVSANATTTTTTTSSIFRDYYWVFVASAVSITVIILFIILYLRAARPYQYEYKPPTQ